MTQADRGAQNELPRVKKHTAQVGRGHDAEPNRYTVLANKVSLSRYYFWFAIPLANVVGISILFAGEE